MAGPAWDAGEGQESMSISARTLLRGASAVVAATALVFAASAIQPAEAGGTSSVTITPASPNVAAGADINIQVNISNVTDTDGLGAYEFVLSFDPNVLAYESFADGSFLGSTGRSVTCLPARLDVDGDTIDDPGFVRLACATLSPTPAGPTGGGTLASVTLSTSCAGNSLIAFSKVNLSDPLGEDIPPANTSGATATVTGSPPCAAGGVVGDSNCNGTVNAIDAALVLQNDAGLLGTIPCADLADANQNGSVNAIDATLILQYDAGFLAQLPP
jgi:hypothetical protein